MACSLVRDVVSRRFTAWDDGFEEEIFILLNERHEPSVALVSDDHDALPWIFFRIGMRHNLHKPASFNGHGDVLERKAALVQQSFVFFQIPAKWFFHVATLGLCLPNVNGRLGA